MTLALTTTAATTIAALVGAGGVLVGSALSFVASKAAWKRERRERRREERREAYEALLHHVQLTAHRLGNLGDEDYGAPAFDRQTAAYLVDTEVTPRVRTIQLIVPVDREVVVAALELRHALNRFRDAMTRTETPPKYRTDAYTAVYDPVAKARDRFLTIAAADLESGSGSP